MGEELFDICFGLVEFELIVGHLGRGIFKSPAEIVEWEIQNWDLLMALCDH